MKHTISTPRVVVCGSNNTTSPAESKNLPRITWVLRSFLDYRVPVFAELDALAGNGLHVIFPDTQTPERVRRKLKTVLGPRAIELNGERTLGTNKPSREFANASWCLPQQPGLWDAIKRTCPDVLIGDGFFQWSTLALLHRVIRKTPFVVCYERTFHTERRAQWYRRWYRRMAIRHVDAMCCNGSLSVDYSRSLGMDNARMTTGFMASDTGQLAAQVESISRKEREAKKKSLQVSGTCYLYVGQLIARKGVRQLLNGWQRFEATSPGAGTLILVGNGDQDRELRDLVLQCQLRNVRFLGSIDYDQMAQYYAAADVLVMPTLEDNWSLVVPEAMACGLPVLCSIYNGCWPELVHNDENGWTFCPLNQDDIVRMLKLAVDNQTRLPAMGQRSREIVSQFTPQHAARAIFDACQIALSHRRRGGRLWKPDTVPPNQDAPSRIRPAEAEECRT